MINWQSIIFVCFFTFLINITETLAYSMRYAGLKTRQIAIAMSFVTSTLLISRLSNMFQAPLLGKMVDDTIKIGTQTSLHNLELAFRIILFSGFLGILLATILTPSMVKIYELAIHSFLRIGSLPRMFFLTLISPRRFKKIINCLTWPKFSMLKDIHLKSIPKKFLILNGLVASIYSIGVLSSLLAGAYLPDLRATAIQLSGIVNGIATILFTLMVDPTGARITDQAVHKKRPDADVKSVVFFLIISRIIGVLIISQLILFPAVEYIMAITRLI
ncbi:MAG: DUF2837 family protein [Candidatus Margulisbacteria bacterium]|nr:DUF2837 family protein [Candidatus Margulisiibacteriota bacterium]